MGTDSMASCQAALPALQLTPCLLMLWFVIMTLLSKFVRYCFVFLMPQGEICDIDGTCVDAADDEIFKLTTKGGSLSVEREKVSIGLGQRRLQVLVGPDWLAAPQARCGRAWPELLSEA